MRIASTTSKTATRTTQAIASTLLFIILLKTTTVKLLFSAMTREIQLTPAAAKLYLDRKAHEFNATFEVDEQGNIFYQFPLGFYK